MKKNTILFSIVMGISIVLEFFSPVSIPLLSACFIGFFVISLTFSQVVFLSFTETIFYIGKTYTSYMIIPNFLQSLGLPYWLGIFWVVTNYVSYVPLTIGVMYLTAFILKKIHPKYYDYMRSLK